VYESGPRWQHPPDSARPTDGADVNTGYRDALLLMSVLLKLVVQEGMTACRLRLDMHMMLWRRSN
jgi:hypothetical protein